MKKLISIVLVAIGVLMSSFSEEEGKWIIDPDSRLIIHGATNINTFKCSFDSYDNTDTLEFSKKNSLQELIFYKNRMRIPVKRFDCGSRQITRDFWETLKVESHPYLDIKFKSLQNIRYDKCEVNGVVDITLAGVTKRYGVKYHVALPSANTVLLKGNQSVNFSDFKLHPPQKLMGLIQVQECLDVEFNLTLKIIE